MKPSTATLFLVTVLIAGCASPARQTSHLSKETLIEVTVLPVAGQTEQLELTAVLHRSAKTESKGNSRQEEDQFTFPKTIATLTVHGKSLCEIEAWV